MITSEENIIHILLVEDDELWSELASTYLASYGYQLTSLTHGEALRNILTTHSVDLVILDIDLPGKNGLYWAGWIKNNYPDIPIVICSAKSSADDRLKGFEKGVSDYIVKPLHLKELLIRIQNILLTPYRYIQPELPYKNRKSDGSYAAE